MQGLVGARQIQASIWGFRVGAIETCMVVPLCVVSLASSIAHTITSVLE